MILTKNIWYHSKNGMEPGTSSLSSLWEKLIEWPLFIHLAMALTLPWIATSLGLGFALVPILVLVILYLHTVDQIQKSRFTIFLRGRIEEEAIRRTLVTNIETVQWLNGLLLACWPSVEVFLSSEIATLLQSKLDHNRPKIVQKFIVDRFRLGSCPPIIQSVQVTRHPGISSSSSGNVATAVLEMDFSFVAAKDMAIEITASLNFGLAGKLFADHMMIVGRLRMCFKFIPFHPFVGHLSIAFVSMPQLGISIRPLSSSSVAVTDLPMVASWVTKVAETIVETLLVDPFSIELDFVEKFHPDITQLSHDNRNEDNESSPFSRSGIASSLKDKPFYIILEIIEGKNLEAKDRSGYSDPYVTIKFNKMKFKTSIKKQTLNPMWHETFRLKVTSSSYPHNSISLRVRDHDTFGKDDELGWCDVNLNKLDLKYGKKQDMWMKLREVKSGHIHISINMVHSYDKKEASDGSKTHQKNSFKQAFPFTSPTSKHSSNDMHNSRNNSDYSNLDHDISPSARVSNIPPIFGEDNIVTDGNEVGVSNYTTFDEQKGGIPIQRTFSGSILFSSKDEFFSNSFK